MMVWQGHDRNEWATAMRQALTGDPTPVPAPVGSDPFSLADPSTVEAVLTTAGFTQIGFIDVAEPVYYGPNAVVAYDLVCSLQSTQDQLARLDPAAAEAARERLRAMLAARETGSGVCFESRAWIVTAHRGGAGASVR